MCFSAGTAAAETQLLASLNLLSRSRREIRTNEGVFSSSYLVFSTLFPPFFLSLPTVSLADLSFARVSRGHDLRF